MRTAIYKGKEYILEFCGDTKYGKRCHLAFLDGSKSFWVNADLVTGIDNRRPTLREEQDNDFCEWCDGDGCHSCSSGRN